MDTGRPGSDRVRSSLEQAATWRSNTATPQAEDDILGSQIPVPKPLFPTIPSWVGGRSPKNLYRVVVSKDVLFSPLFVGDDPISQAYFLKGLKPPISYDIVNFDKPLRIQTPPDWIVRMFLGSNPMLIE